MSDWKSFVVQVPGKDFLEPVRGILETLLIFLELLKAILETVKIFLIDFGNPIRALVEALIGLIEELFLALKQSGFFMYADIPNPIEHPGWENMRGGFDAFVTRFNGSLFDVKDFNRPQPRGSNRGGFVILMVDATTPWQLIQYIDRLLAFFGKGFETPQYEAPNNFKVIPVGADGDPILAAAQVFTSGPIEKIQLQWTLPSTQESPDSGFFDALQQVYQEVVPPKFLIERSEEINPASRRIDISQLGVSFETGVAEYDQKTQFRSKGEFVTRKQPLLDTSGEPVIRFQSYKVVDLPTQILGALGKFRYIDEEVTADKDYYYRVRAFIGDLDIDESTGQIKFPDSLDSIKKTQYPNNTTVPTMPWPSKDSDAVVMGKPTGIVKARIPPDFGDFDVIDNLKNVFLAAFSLDFHQQVPLDEQGKSVFDFDDSGNPINNTPNTAVGKGSMTNLSGIVMGWESASILSFLSEFDTIPAGYTANSITGLPPEMPWTRFLVVQQAARLADIVATAMLQLGADVAYGFQDLMTSLPRGPISVKHLYNMGSMSEVLEQFTEVQTEVEAGEDVGLLPPATLEAVEAYAEGYYDVTLRLSVLDIVQYLKSFTLGGVPPDWISIVPLRDIIPWSATFIYDLLDKIQALIDAFNGVMQEIRDFIDLLIRKIDALEAFIQLLIDILNFIESLQIGAYILSVPSIDGGVSAWVDAVNTAGGVRPPSGPGGYSAGIGLAYVAPNIEAFARAFSIIFGS